MSDEVEQPLAGLCVPQTHLLIVGAGDDALAVRREARRERHALEVADRLALAAGEVELVIASAVSMNPQLKANRIRAIAITSAEPSRLLPGLPPLAASPVARRLKEIGADVRVGGGRVGRVRAVVPVTEAEGIVDALFERRVPHAYLLYPGEDHGFRQAKNIIRSFEAELSFYGQIFGFSPADEFEPLEIVNLPAGAAG